MEYFLQNISPVYGLKTFYIDIKLLNLLKSRPCFKER